MQRLNRNQSQERTRAAILEAARELFLGKGFRASSVEEIAEAAGFSTGAVYSNFQNKTAIGIAVIDALYTTEQQRADALLAEAIERGQPWYEAVAVWAETAIGNPQWGRLEMEVFAFSAGERSPASVRAASERYADFRTRIAVLIDAAAHENGVSPALDSTTLATAVVAFGLGLGMQRAADPGLPAAEVFTGVLREMVAAAGARWRESPGQSCSSAPPEIGDSATSAP